MDQELVQFLQGMETRLSEGFRKEIAEAKSQLRTEISEQVEKIETSLLTEFHKWARTYEMRDRSTAMTVSTFAERFSLMEDRVSELERYLPPPSKRLT